MTSFSESRLELFPTKWQVTVSFDTLILENGAGAEMRYSRIVEPRFSFSASDMILTKAEYDYLKAFFEARKGKFQGFRFTNPLDYQTSAIEVELSTDITTQGLLIETATAGEYQLVKRYTVAGVNCYKTIRKIKQVISGPTIDLNTGIAASGGAVSCEYDLMVRFDQDEIELTHITVESAEYGSIDAYRVIGLQLVEDNYPKVYGYTEADFADLEFTFVPSPLPEVTKGTNTVTRIEASQSQKETRISFSEGKAVYKFGQNALYQSEVDVFYTLFLACMGRKKAFTYDGVGVRFSSDQLTLNLEVIDGNYAVWQLSGLEVVATEPFIGPPPPPPPPPPSPLEGLRWEFPCSGTYEPNRCYTPDNIVVTTISIADTGEYTLRFRGIVEGQSYTGGSQDGDWYAMPSLIANEDVPLYCVNDSANSYLFSISDPPQSYFLNSGFPLEPLTVVDFTKTVTINAGATVSIYGISDPINNFPTTGTQVSNSGNAAVPGVPPYPLPYDGQFIEVTVLSIA